MITFLISAVLWQTIGMVAASPLLATFYNVAVDITATKDHSKCDPNYSLIGHVANHPMIKHKEKIMPWVASFYALSALFWPASILWAAALLFARKATPQVRAEIEAEKREKVEAELLEAQKIIASFNGGKT